ncbi:ribonuclease activity regulator RraA [bacterium]|nr:MAG: ribonuclease activity regulator RraA [bacterium]
MTNLPASIALLGEVSTATISTQLFKRGLRNAFLQGLYPLNPGCARFVGEAFTLRSIPSREDLDVLAVYEDYDHPQRRAVESVESGQVLVVDSRSDVRAASAGQILLTRLLKRGAVAFVTDGSLRDSGEIRKMEFPAFVAGVAATTNLARHHVVDMQVPISCAGVAIYPGDILVGDEEGVICVPRHLAPEIAQPAAEQERMERFILGKIAAGAPLRGVYPPDSQTRGEYELWSRSDRREARHSSQPTLEESR